MPDSVGKRKQLLVLRRHVRTVLALPSGTAKGAVESAVMSTVRRMWAQMAAADREAEVMVLPDDDTVKNVYNGLGVEVARPARAPVAAATGLTRQRMYSRAADAFLSEQREVLQAAVRRRHPNSKTFCKRWRRHGWPP